jgi:hypothetical protein
MDRIDFHHWYYLLRCDASRCGKLTTVLSLGDYVLELFWEIGAEPSVEGILQAAES